MPGPSCRGGGTWPSVASPSADLNYFTPSRKILAVPCQDEEGNLNFPSEMGGTEALWCSELLLKVGRAEVAVLGWAGGQRAPGKPRAQEGDISCWCSWRDGWKWLGRAGRQSDSTALGRANQQTKTGQNDRPEVSRIEKECMSALKSRKNFLAHRWQNFRRHDRGKVL